MGLDKNLFRNWVDGEPFSARDYVYERDLLIDFANALITEEDVLEGLFDDRYYNKIQLNDGQLDNRYFRKLQIAPIEDPAVQGNGSLDERYFVKTETNSLVNAVGNRAGALESKFSNTLLTQGGIAFNQNVTTSSPVEFASVKLGANTVNEAFIDGLEDKYTVANADSTFIKQNQLGVAGGVATLEAGTGRLPLSQLPLNTVVFKGTFGEGLNDLPTVGVTTGDFYICAAADSTTGYDSIVSGLNFFVGDKAVFDGTNWSKIDNTETVTSVEGSTHRENNPKIGSVMLGYQDVGAAPLVHTHVEADITDLDKYTQGDVNTFLAGKSDTGHTHLEANITDLDKYTQQEVNDALLLKSDVGHTHTESEIVDLDKYTQQEVNDALALKVNTSIVGQPNGIVPLNGEAIPKIDAIYLPSYVDDVLEYADLASFPATGNSGKIYVARDTGRVYRWGSTQYVEIAANSVLSVNGYTATVVLTDADIAVNATGFTGSLTTDAINVELALAELDVHTHTEDDITNLDKYTQSQIDAFLAEKANVSDLSASITLYPTTTPSAVSGYFTMVTDITDTRYNDVAFDVGTGAITSQNQLIASLATDPSIFTGNPGVINVTTIGNIRKTAGNTNAFAEFFYRIFQRKADGTEIQIGISETTGAVNPEILDIYFEFSAAAILNNGTFETTDRVVIKYYANAIEGTTSQYDFQFGGVTPVRTLLPVPVRVLQSAERIVYDNTITGLTATNLQDAVDELDQLIQENTSVIKVQQFVINDPNKGDGTFTYFYNGSERVGNLQSGTYQFGLEDNVEYIVGENRVEVKINNDTTFYAPDSEMLEVNPTQIAITYAFQPSDEIFFKVYQGLDSVALVVPDGTITTAKLSQALADKIDTHELHVANTNNPHGVTKSQVGLGNVTNDAQVKADASGSINGYVATWLGTNGDALGTGYGVQTTLSSSVGDLVRADAIATAVGAKQDTLVSGVNIKTINGSNILGSGDYEIDIPAVSVSNVAPVNANVGDLWWNSTNGVLYIYYNDGTSSQWVAVSYADVESEINALIANAPEALNTLNELATALGNDANFATTVATELNLKASQTALNTLSGVVDTKAKKLVEFIPIIANHTVELTDANKVLNCTNTASIIINVPADSFINFPIGSQIAFLRNGTGEVAFTPAVGVTLQSTDNKRKIKGQYSSAAVIKIAADTWQLVGSLEA